MSAVAAAPGRMTAEQYLAWTDREPLEGAWELVDGVPVKMSPERNVHALVKGAIFGALRDAVARRGLDHTVFVDGPSVRINDYRVRQPDVVVQPRDAIDWSSLVVPSPLIIVEVTSPSTVRTDLNDKLVEYFSLPSVQHYLVVHIGGRQVEHHRRLPDGSIDTVAVQNGRLRLDPPGLEVEVALFFQELPPEKAH